MHLKRNGSLNASTEGFRRAGAASGRTLRPTTSRGIRKNAVVGETVPRIVRWSLLLFIFTIPFEGVDFFITSGTFSLAKLSGLFFIVFYFLYYNPFLSRRSFPGIPGSLWWFLGYVAIFALNGLTLGQEFLGEAPVDKFFLTLRRLVQLVFITWPVSNLLREEKLAKRALLTLGVASGFLGIALVAGFGTMRIAGQTGDVVRATALGYDPNLLAVLLALSAVILIGLLLNKDIRNLGSKILLLVLILALLMAIISTGSRTGVLTFITGTSVYLLSVLWVRRKITTIILASLAVITLVFMIARDPVSLIRWGDTYYEGETSGRQEIILTSVEMIWEKPLFGWRGVEWRYELGLRKRGYGQTDTHNLFLALFLEVGVFGATPFLIGLWLCTRTVWKARSGKMGNVPLASFIAILTANLAVNMLRYKLTWIILALAMASKAYTYAGLSRRQRPHVRDSQMKVPH